MNSVLTITSVSTWNLIFDKLRENRAELVAKLRSALNVFVKKQKGSLAAPLLANLLCRFGSAQTARMFLERRAPQKRCDQLWCSSKPGGVIVPPELDELTSRLYSLHLLIASKEMGNPRERPALPQPSAMLHAT
jgi:hypothetical protein